MVFGLILKIVILVFAIIAKHMLSSVEPIIKNNIYLSQLDNTTEGFMNMQLYPMIGDVCHAIMMCIAILIIVDIVTIIKLRKGEGK